jgi:hypothetical protein
MLFHSTSGLLLPPQHGRRGDAEEPSGVVGGEGEEVPEAEDPESGFRSVVRALPLGELAPTGAVDVDHLSQALDVEDLHQGMEGEGVEASALHGGSQEAIEEGGRGIHRAARRIAAKRRRHRAATSQLQIEEPPRDSRSSTASGSRVTKPSP